ncbi:hypothetical protein [Clostridium botulinum]|uniref:hypothetical protein n=1 Tax=Clostridium botulinum TaxID=1491 RepID=UPI0006A4B284|nr:hypothetical protein [Clostridium botulinum]KOC31255.1 hypothetical protein ADU81_14060 [Clostridium botulinum]
MRKTTEFYLKIMIKNPLFFISLFFNVFLLYKQSSALEFSMFEFSQVFYFGFICSNLFFLIISTYVTYKNYIILNFLEKNLLKKQISIILSSIIISTITSLIPILTMLILKNPIFQLKFVVTGVLHFFIIWILSNLLAATIGCFVGSICKNSTSMIISPFIYSLFAYHSYNSSSSPLWKLFNIYDDFTMIDISNICGHLFNRAYYFDKLFVVLLALFIFSLICAFNKNIKRLYSGLFVCFTAACIFINVFFTFNHGSTYLKEYHSLENVNYTIESYNMNLKLKNTLENTVTINVKINKNSDNINMLFDDLFKVKALSINEVQSTFNHENNTLKIKHNCTKGDRLKILIKYTGGVDVVNDVGSPIYYVSKYATNLPITAFYWYPKTIQDSLIDFDISVNAYNSIYSNLNLLNCSDNIYKFKGQSLGLNLFSGQYKKYILNNIEYIIPTSMDLKYFESYISDIIKDENNIKNLSKKQLDFVKNHKYKKVICCIWEYNPKNKDLNPIIQIFEDTLIIH